MKNIVVLDSERLSPQQVLLHCLGEVEKFQAVAIVALVKDDHVEEGDDCWAGNSVVTRLELAYMCKRFESYVSEVIEPDGEVKT